MKTLAVWLCLIIVAAAISLAAFAQNPNLESPVCKSCRDQCVSARVRCKSQVCKNNGGQDNGPNACINVKNQQGFVDGLKACETQEAACWNQCQAGACK
jgi:hypothetical protein